MNVREFIAKFVKICEKYNIETLVDLEKQLDIAALQNSRKVANEPQGITRLLRISDRIQLGILRETRLTSEDKIKLLKEINFTTVQNLKSLKVKNNRNPIFNKLLKLWQCE